MPSIGSVTADLELREDRFNRGIDRVERRLRKLAGLMAAFGTAAAGYLAFKGLKAAMEGTVGSAIEMESAMSRIRKVTGLTGSDLAKLQKQIGGLSTTMAGVDVSSLLAIAEQGGRMGIAAADIGTFTRDIGMAAIALNDVPADELATSISRILTVFNRGMDEALGFASALNKMDDSSTASARDILDLTQRLSGTAAVLGMTPAKVLAFATAVQDAGVSTEVAGTAFSAIFGQMASDSTLFAQVAGVSMEQFTNMMRREPLMALDAFLRGLKRFDALTQFQILDQMGIDGQRARSSLLQVSAVMGRLPRYIRQTNSETESFASIMAEVKAQGMTTEAQVERLKNILIITAAGIGDAMLPIIRDLADSFGYLSQKVGQAWDSIASTEGFQRFIAKAREVSQLVGTLFTQFDTWKSLGISFATEGLDALMTILGRLGEEIGNQFQYGFQYGWEVGKNVLMGLGRVMEDIFKQMGPMIEDILHNVMVNLGKDHPLAGLMGVGGGLFAGKDPTAFLKTLATGGTGAGLEAAGKVLGGQVPTSVLKEGAFAGTKPALDLLGAMFGLKGAGAAEVPAGKPAAGGPAPAAGKPAAPAAPPGPPLPPGHREVRGIDLSPERIKGLMGKPFEGIPAYKPKYTAAEIFGPTMTDRSEERAPMLGKLQADIQARRMDAARQRLQADPRIQGAIGAAQAALAARLAAEKGRRTLNAEAQAARQARIARMQQAGPVTPEMMEAAGSGEFQGSDRAVARIMETRQRVDAETAARRARREAKNAPREDRGRERLGEMAGTVGVPGAGLLGPASAIMSAITGGGLAEKSPMKEGADPQLDANSAALEANNARLEAVEKGLTALANMLGKARMPARVGP